MNQFRMRDVDIDGQPVHLVEAGTDVARNDRPVIVLVHGIGVSNWYFRPLMRQLADEYHVVAIDLPGFGRSPVPGRRYSVADYAAVVNKVVHREGWKRPLLIGHSMGCQVASDCERQRPGICRGLVLLGPTIAAGRRSIPKQAGRLLLDSFREPLRTTAVVTADYIRSSTRQYIRTVRPMLDDQMEDRLPHIDPPVLFVRGSRDPVSTRGWCRQLADRTSGGRLEEVDGAAHNFQHSHPQQTAALCRIFLKELE